MRQTHHWKQSKANGGDCVCQATAQMVRIVLDCSGGEVPRHLSNADGQTKPSCA